MIPIDPQLPSSGSPSQDARGTPTGSAAAAAPAAGAGAADAASPRPSGPQRAPEPAFFDEPAIDNLIAVTLELGGELWLQKERTRMLEALLVERGILTREQLEAWQPSESEAESARLERESYVNRVFGALVRKTVRATPDP